MTLRPFCRNPASLPPSLPLGKRRRRQFLVLQQKSSQIHFVFSLDGALGGKMQLFA